MSHDEDRLARIERLLEALAKDAGYIDCPVCYGSGRRYGDLCTECMGDGLIKSKGAHSGGERDGEPKP